MPVSRPLHVTIRHALYFFGPVSSRGRLGPSSLSITPTACHTTILATRRCPQRLACRLDDRSSDIALNRVMRATITRLQQVLSGCRCVDEHRLFERDDDGLDIH